MAGLSLRAFTAEWGGDFAEDDFPGDPGRDMLLAAWLEQAKGHAEAEQRAYVNWRANRHIARRMNLESARMRVEDRGERQRLVSQIRYFEAEAEKYRAGVPAVLIEGVEGAAGASSEEEEATSEWSVVTSLR